MRKIILELLKTKFEGVSEQVLGRIADKLAKTVKTQEEATTAVEGVTLQQVIDSYGDSRANEAQQTAVKNYESKYGLKDGAKVKDGSDQTTTTATETENGGEEPVPAWAKALIESNKALGERLNKMDGENTAKNRKQQLSTILAKLPETLRKPYERIPLDTMSDDDFTALQEEISADVETIVKETSAKGAVFGRPVNNSNANKGTAGGGNEKEATDEEAKAVVDRLSI